MVPRLRRLNRGFNRWERLHAGLVRRGRRQSILEWRSVIGLELGCDIWWQRSSAQVVWGLRDLLAVSGAGQANQWRSRVVCTYRSQVPTILFRGRGCCIN